MQRLLLGEAWQGYVRDMEIREAIAEMMFMNPDLLIGPKAQKLLA